MARVTVRVETLRASGLGVCANEMPLHHHAGRSSCGRLTPHVWLGSIRPRSQCVGGMLLAQWCCKHVLNCLRADLCRHWCGLLQTLASAAADGSGGGTAGWLV